MVTVFSAEEDDKVGDKVGDKLTANQNKIIEILRHNSRVTAKELSVIIGISQRNVEANIRKLRM
ncbi:MAG TPA: AsnC family protein [Tenuifilaceae bacterium]|nr:AsnC family protein [Tenuifilaceae bacterium]